MAHLGIIGSHSVNGVAGMINSRYLVLIRFAIHTEILKQVVFVEFYELWPDKFNNKTNGVTPRRWIHVANHSLSELLTETLGSDEWMTNLACVEKLRDVADDPNFQKKFMQVKRKAKVLLSGLGRNLTLKMRLRDKIFSMTSGLLDVNVDALFDIQVKRIHEYKRQLLNILGYKPHRRLLKSLE